MLLMGLALDVSAQEVPETAGGVLEETLGVESESESELEEAADVRTLADWFEMGGWVMYLLVLTSILSLIVILERAWATRSGAIVPRALLRKIREATNRGEVQQVTALVGTGKTAIARVLRSGLVHFGEGLQSMEESVGFATDHESTRLRRNLGLLAALGNMATMMGLMGTVLGMIESFDLIAKTGTGDARVVAGGIFQALVTTAAGLREPRDRPQREGVPPARGPVARTGARLRACPRRGQGSGGDLRWPASAKKKMLDCR
jgi:biopolymer transport protein ExbB